MKIRKKQAILLLLFTIFCLLFTTCEAPLEIPAPEAESEYGTVRISFNDDGRTVFPAKDFDNFVYTFTIEGGTPETMIPDEGVFYLLPGNWNVRVDAYIGPDVAANGNADFTLEVDESKTITIILYAEETDGYGTFSFYITYPADTTVEVFTLTKLPEMTVTDFASNAGPTFATGTDETVPAGMYQLTLRLKNDSMYAGTTVVVHIYDKLTSEFGTEDSPIVFEKIDFSNPIYITGNMIPGQTLSVDTTFLLGTGTITYLWKRGDTAGDVTEATGTDSAGYLLTAGDIGKYITVTVSREGVPGTVTSNAAGPIIDITIVSSSTTVGHAHTLSAVIVPESFVYNSIEWSVVSGEAAITGNTLICNEEGTVTVKATVITGRNTATYYAKNFDITVIAASNPMSFTETSITKTYGDEPFTNTFSQQAQGDGELTFTSSDESTATVAADGEVTIHGAGTVIITAVKESDGLYDRAEASYTLIVEKAAGATLIAPTAIVTHNSITVNEVTAPANGQAIQYGINTTNAAPSSWQDSRIFNGLASGTTYHVFVRAVESTNYLETVSAGTAVTTLLSFTGNFEYYWLNERDVIATTTGGNSINLPIGETLTITANGEGYTNERWYINGLEDLTQAGSTTYNFNSEGKELKRYTIDLLVQKGGRYYSATFIVDVIEEP